MPTIPLGNVPFRNTITLAVATLIVPALVFKLKLYPSASVRSLTTFCDRLTWTIRAAVLPSPLPQKLEQWVFSNEAEFNIEQQKLEMANFYRSWKFLEPFFASHGYVLYTFFKPPTSMLIAVPSDPEIRRRNVPEYPYARHVYNEDIEVITSCGSHVVWPARDLLGRDVMIKIVADDTTRNELEILQILNTETMRRDPRNHTILVIELLKFQQYTFVVMPRWYAGLWLDFGTVDELMWFAQSMLEVFDFLHEHHIVHFDFLLQNLGINVLSSVHDKWTKGLLSRSVTKYALFDFGNAKQYPLNVPIDEVQDTRFFGFSLRGFPNPKRHVRHIENIIPSMGPFFDAMTDSDVTKRLTAHQALSEFKYIYSHLSESELNTQVLNLWWENGIVTPKRNLEDS